MLRNELRLLTRAVQGCVEGSPHVLGMRRRRRLQLSMRCRPLSDCWPGAVADGEWRLDERGAFEVVNHERLVGGDAGGVAGAERAHEGLEGPAEEVVRGAAGAEVVPAAVVAVDEAEEGEGDGGEAGGCVEYASVREREV